MAENELKLVLVDTNCLVRVYFSPLRPVLSQPASGYELRTLKSLADELKDMVSRREEFAWLSAKSIQDEVELAIVHLSPAQIKNIDLDTVEIRRQGNSLLAEFCKQKDIPKRTLSKVDASILATALELKTALSTDEWPLRQVAQIYSNDEGQTAEVFSSVDLIAMLEEEGLLSKEERRKTYSDWLKFGEALLRESPKIYFERFGERPPDAQY